MKDLLGLFLVIFGVVFIYYTGGKENKYEKQIVNGKEYVVPTDVSQTLPSKPNLKLD